MDTFWRPFRALLRDLKRPGLIAIWVYRRGRWFGMGSELLRLATTRMPARSLYGLCRRAVPVLQRLYRLPVAGRVFRLIPASDQGRGLEADVLDTFDWYSPRYQWKYEPDEVAAWFTEAGLERIEQAAFPVAVRGAKV